MSFSNLRGIRLSQTSNAAAGRCDIKATQQIPFNWVVPFALEIVDGEKKMIWYNTQGQIDSGAAVTCSFYLLLEELCLELSWQVTECTEIK